MTFLPIVERELRVASRRRSTYWLRTAAVGIVVLVGTWIFLMMQGEPPRTVAMILFCTLTGGVILYSLCSGVRSTADCLSEEKREGTLGLLFLTDLKGYDVVFGKLAATSLNVFYSAVAVVPVLAIPLLLGGITPGEFGRTALVAVNTLFFSLAIGVGVSAMSRSAQKAMGMTLLLLLFFAGLIPLSGFIVAELGRTRGVLPWFLIPSPFFSHYMALDANYKTGAALFWYSMAFIHGAGWLFLALASVVVRRAWQDRPAGAQALRWRERWQLWVFGNTAERTAFRRSLLDRNAFFWLVARKRLKPAAVWAFFGLLACVWFWGLLKFRREWLNQEVYLGTAFCLNLFIRCWFSVEASRQMAEERKAGTFELLLSTPLSVRDILRGQWLALQRQFLGPMMAILVIEFLFLFATMSDSLIGTDRAFWFCLWCAGMVMLVADLTALYWVGMWQGLRAKHPSHASGAALARVLGIPWIAYAVVLLILALASLRGAGEPELGWQFFLGLAVILGLTADIGFAVYSRHKLLTEFRLVAQQRYVASAGFWRWLVGKDAGSLEAPPVLATQK